MRSLGDPNSDKYAAFEAGGKGKGNDDVAAAKDRQKERQKQLSKERDKVRVDQMKAQRRKKKDSKRNKQAKQTAQ